jgi:hypothetical protein
VIIRFFILIFAVILLTMAVILGFSDQPVLAALLAFLGGALLVSPALWLLLIFCACVTPMTSLRPLQPIVPDVMEWCIHAVTNKGSLIVLCTEHEITCRWVQRNAETYGRLADLDQIGTCTR